jgi:hypothetical protein
VAAAAVALALALPAVAFAFDKPCGGGFRAACGDDVTALCPNADSHWARRHCLKEHRDQLSAACGAKLDALHQCRQAIRAACAADVNALCPDADNPRDRLHCLHEHRAELSEACAEALPRHNHSCKAPG